MPFNVHITTITKAGENNEEAENKWHIGGNVYVTVKRGWPYVDIRQFWVPTLAADEALKQGFQGPSDFRTHPTKRGICLTYNELARFTELIESFEGAVPGLKELQPCIDDHANQVGMLQCSHCNPNGCFSW